MKKIIIGAFALTLCGLAPAAPVKVDPSKQIPAYKLDDQYRLLDELTILKIKLDTWFDISQLDTLYKQAQDIVDTFNAMTTTAGQQTKEFKTLTENRNDARKLMLKITSIYRRRKSQSIWQPTEK